MGGGQSRAGQGRRFFPRNFTTNQSGFKNRDQLEKGGNKIKSLKHTHTLMIEGGTWNGNNTSKRIAKKKIAQLTQQRRRPRRKAFAFVCVMCVRADTHTHEHHTTLLHTHTHTHNSLHLSTETGWYRGTPGRERSTKTNQVERREGRRERRRKDTHSTEPGPSATTHTHYTISPLSLSLPLFFFFLPPFVRSRSFFGLVARTAMAAPTLPHPSSSFFASFFYHHNHRILFFFTCVGFFFVRSWDLFWCDSAKILPSGQTGV